MIYYLTAFIVGISIGFSFGVIASGTCHRDSGQLKITNDEDGTYCFLILRQDPNELKDGDSIVLLVDKDTTHK